MTADRHNAGTQWHPLCWMWHPSGQTGPASGTCDEAADLANEFFPILIRKQKPRQVTELL